MDCFGGCFRVMFEEGCREYIQGGYLHLRLNFSKDMGFNKISIIP